MLGCVTVEWTDAATAGVAALVASLGTLAAKHRPAGAMTRSTDRRPPGNVATVLDDGRASWQTEETQDALPGPQPTSPPP